MRIHTFRFSLLFFLVLSALFPSLVLGEEGAELSIAVDYASAPRGEAGKEGGLVAAVWLTTPRGYYTYAHEDSGSMPTRLSVNDAQGKALPVFYPKGTQRQDFFDPSRRILAYEGRFPLFVQVPSSLWGKGALTAHLSLLLCSKQNCLPLRKDIVLSLTGELVGLDETAWAGQYKEALARAGSQAPSALAAKPNESLGQTASAGPDSSPGPDSSLGQASSAGQAASLSLSGSGLSPDVAPVPDASELSAAFGRVRAKTTEGGEPFPGRVFVPRYFQAGLEPTALSTALLLGLLAGLLLNIMPCVLPVLTMKLSGLLAVSGQSDKAAQRASLREHALFFSAGIMTWFTALAVTVGGLGVAWGGLFQSSLLVYGLLIFIFLLALSMFDLFTLPILDFKVGASGNPRLQAYLTGLVATLLATPCSGPLLGGVLGWAVLQPLPSIFAVFLATGLGMSVPYLALAVWPGAARLLPRPGPWMGVMERLVGFFLLGAAIYLLSILPQSQWLAALVTLLIAAFAAFAWGHWGGLGASPRRRLITRVCATCLVAVSVWWSVQPPAPPLAWTPFSVGTFQSLLGKEPLLVEFTADWCPSCKVLERTSLAPAKVQPLVERYGLRLIKVDMTRPDADAEALLRAVGSVSIPVTAIFPKGLLAKSPLILRDLYTPGQLEEALGTLPVRP